MLHKAAQFVANNRDGNLPGSSEELRALPGVGAYTSAAIASIAFGEPVAVVDGNVERVLCRVAGWEMPGRAGAAMARRKVDELAARLVDPDRPGDFNQAMMELGATLCTPRAPRCLVCPVRQFCRARRLGIAAELPDKRKKRAPARVELAAAVFLDARRKSLLLPPPTGSQKSKADDHVPSLVAKLWHFPTVPAGGNPEDTLREFLAANLQKTAATLQLEALAKVRHSVTYRRITVTPFALAAATCEPQVTRLPELLISESAP